MRCPPALRPPLAQSAWHDLEHLLGIHLGGRAGTEQIFRFDFPGWFAVMVDAAGQPGGLLGKREIDGLGFMLNSILRLQQAYFNL